MSSSAAELRAFKESVEKAKSHAAEEIPSWALPNESPEDAIPSPLLPSPPGVDKPMTATPHEEFGTTWDPHLPIPPTTPHHPEPSLGFLPALHDTHPPVFALRVRRGAAERLVKQILLRAIQAVLRGSATAGESLLLTDPSALTQEVGLYSVFTPTPNAQYVYVECGSKRQLLALLSGLREVYPHRLTTVATQERRPLLVSCLRRRVLYPGDYARITRGTYKGDLCQVLATGETAVKVRVIPRMDYSAVTEPVGSHDAPQRGSNRVSKKPNPPSSTPAPGSHPRELSKLKTKPPLPPHPFRRPQRFFSPALVPPGGSGGTAVERLPEGTWGWGPHEFDPSGYLLLPLRPSALSHGPSMPPPGPEELSRFLREASSVRAGGGSRSW